MTVSKIQSNFFLVALLVGILLTLAIFRSYLVLLAFAGVLSILMRPIFHRFFRLVKSNSLAAFLTVVTLTVIILVPITLIGFALYNEIAGAVILSRTNVSSLDASKYLLDHLPDSFRNDVPALMDMIARSLQQVGAAISKGLVGFFSDAVGIIVSFLIMLIAVYYLQKDGKRIKEKLLVLSPLNDKYDELVLGRIVVAVQAVMGGQLVMAIIKAFLAGLAFWICGVPSPIFWGGMTGFASLVPILGTGLVTVPAIAYLLISGKIGAGIGLLSMAVLIIGMVDNLLQPMLVQRKTAIHPLLVLLSILGGLQFYGFAGFILGPLTLTVTMALLDIYEGEFRSHLKDGS